MLTFMRKTLNRKLGALFFLSTVVPVTLVSIISFQSFSETHERKISQELTAVNDSKSHLIIEYLKARIGDLKLLSGTREIHRYFDLLRSYHDSGGAEPEGPYDISTRQYRSIYSRIDPFFRKHLEVYGYKDVYFICKRHGHVMYTSAQKQDLGTNLRTGPYRSSALSEVWSRVLDRQEPVLLDISSYKPSPAPVFFLGAPVRNEKEGFYAVLVAQVPLQRLDSLVQHGAHSEKSGQSYLIGQDYRMRSDPHSSSLDAVLEQKVPEKTFSPAFSNNGHGGGARMMRDYRGERVLCAFSHLGLDEELGTGFDWGIVSQMDASEVFAPLHRLGLHILWIAALLTFLVLTAGYFAVRSVAGPLHVLSGKASRAAQGDLSVRLEDSGRQDEVGQLMQSFREMLDNLREQTGQLTSGTSTISSSVSQISSTAAQLASSTSQVSSSVNEISATVEEVRQTANVTDDKARHVAGKAGEVSSISEEGKQQTQEAVAGMNQIKQDMDYVAESITKLNEQTRNIGEIVNTVADLADQSNLLSVNASIEAAKAGEYGKGFSVVAQEVRSLADQSKEATAQIKSILDQVQKATGEAVMAAERAGKTVGSGVELSRKAGDSIATLADTVEESARAAEQIAASSREQLTGMDQIAEAMESIKEASGQNLDSARQLENAIRNLDDLAADMKRQAERFETEG